MKYYAVLIPFLGLFFTACVAPNPQSIQENALIDMALCKEPKVGVSRLLKQMDTWFEKNKNRYEARYALHYLELDLKAISVQGVGYLPGFALLFKAPFKKTLSRVEAYRKAPFKNCSAVACEELLDDGRIRVLKKYKEGLTVVMCADFRP